MGGYLSNTRELDVISINGGLIIKKNLPTVMNELSRGASLSAMALNIKRKYGLIIFALAVGIAAGTVQAADGTWLGNSGNWSDTTTPGGVWNGGTVADGADFTANFTGVNILAAQTITNDVVRTIGNITFTDTTTSHDLTIAAGAALTLDVISGSPVINVTQSGRTLTIGSVVAGTVGLTKSGLGILVLSNSGNTFSGGATIGDGQLRINVDSVLGNTSGGLTFTGTGALLATVNSVVLPSTRTITVNGGAIAILGDSSVNANPLNFTINGQIAGSGGIQVGHYQLGSGQTYLNSTANDFTGSLTLGTSGLYSWTYSSFTLNIASLADGIGYGNIIFGQGNNGAANTATFSWSASAIAPLVLNNRAIQLDAAVETANLSNNNGNTANTITVNTALLISRAGAKTFTLAGSNTGTNIFAGAITNGTGSVISLAKSGAGTWELSGTNTYSGATTLSAGKLVWFVGGSCSNSDVTVSGGTLAVAVTNDAMQWNCKSLSHTAASTLIFDFGATMPSTTVAPIMAYGNVAFTVTPTLNCTGAGLIGLTPGAYPLIKWTGTMSGVTPSVTLSNGNLVRDDVNKTLWLNITGSAQPLTWQGTVDAIWVANEVEYTKWNDATLSGTNYQEYTVSGGILGDSVVFTNIGAGTVTINTTVYPASVLVTGTTNRTFSGSGGIGGGAGLTKAGTNVLILAASNTFSGATIVSAGTLQLAHTNAISSSSSLALANGTTLQLRSDTSDTFNTPAMSVGSSASVTLNADNNVSGSGNTLTMNGSISANNPGANTTFNITGGNGYVLSIPTVSYTNATGANGVGFIFNPTTVDLSLGTVTVNCNGKDIGFVLGGTSTGNSATTINDVSTGNTQFNLQKSGTGTWTVGNVSCRNYLQINSGILIANGTITIGRSGTARNLQHYGGVLHYNNAGAVTFTVGSTDGAIIIQGGNLDNSGGAAITTSTYNPKFQFNGNFTFIGSNGTNSDLYLGTGTVSVAAVRIITVSNELTTLTVGGSITNVGGITKSGAGILKLAGVNTYAGLTTVNAGRLLVAKAGALPGYNAAGRVSVISGAALAVQAGGASEWSSAELDTLLGATTAAFASGARLGIEVLDGSPFTYASDIGAIEATKGLVKSGAGILTLSGANTYTGPTIVKAGTLALGVNNVVADTTAVTIESATLDAATFTDTLGTLDVTNSAVINLGVGAALAFADSSAVDWTGGTLNITGEFVSGSSIRFGTTSSGLTGTQLALISKTGGGTFSLDASGYLTSSGGGDTTPPTLAGSDIVDNVSGGPVLTNTLVTYTVTFSEDMDGTTVTAADFGNAGTASVTIGTVTETSPGIFSVPVTATTGGSLQLRVNASAGLKDVAGNDLDTASAIVDNTTITVAAIDVFTIEASAGANGSIAPNGTVYVGYGSNQMFTITGAVHYSVSDVEVDLTSVGASNSYEFVNVTSNHIISAVFTATLTTNAGPTPTAWLDYYYPGTNDYYAAAESDTDGDNMKAWAEYIAGTDPTNNQSVFEIIQMMSEGLTNVLVWLGGNTNLPPYGVYVTTNLMNANGWGLEANVIRSANGTNYMYHDLSGLTNVPRFYKIVATNTP